MAPQPKDKFVKIQRTKTLCGSKFGSWENAVDECPREQTLLKLKKELDPLLEGEVSVEDTVLCEKINAAMSTIRGKNYSHYESPSIKRLADGTKEKISCIITSIEDSQSFNHVICFERETMTAVLEVHQQWLRAVVTLEAAKDLVPGDKWDLCQVRTHTGIRIIIFVSHFMMYSVDASLTCRFRAVQAYVYALELFARSNNLSRENADKEIKILKSFIMALEFRRQQRKRRIGRRLRARARKWKSSLDWRSACSNSECHTKRFLP